MSTIPIKEIYYHLEEENCECDQNMYMFATDSGICKICGRNFAKKWTTFFLDLRPTPRDGGVLPSFLLSYFGTRLMSYVSLHCLDFLALGPSYLTYAVGALQTCVRTVGFLFLSSKALPTLLQAPDLLRRL